MTPRCLVHAAALVAATALAACDPATKEDERTPPAIAVAKSDLPRAVAPSVPASDAAELTRGNQAFAVDLYKSLREPGRNLLTSPHSVSVALAMAWAGARGETESQMASALHFTLPQARLHAAMNALDQALNSRGQGATGHDGEPFRLRVVNAAWGQSTYQFEQPYLDTLAVNYGAGLNLLDFAGDPEASRLTINDWVAFQTEDRILDLLPSGSITPLTRLVLTNAVYFSAAWAEPFDPANTADAPFTLLDGTRISVPTMNATEALRYAEGEGYKAVELPYDGNELAMVAIVPTGDFTAFEDSLDGAGLSAIFAALAERDTELSMPRFTFEWDSSLVQALGGLGMTAPFSGQADFSGINGGREPLYISDVIHKTFIGVDEKGTEAAAATAVIVAGRGAPTEPASMKLDRPFLFAIRDLQTGGLVFLGRVVDPR
ncbi:MAG: serpin family protein [Myxococcales bacterium]|jgi:serpin B